MHLREIQQALRYGSQMNSDIKALFRMARERQNWETRKHSPYFQPIWQALREDTAALLQQPLTVLPYSLFRLFSETGSRKEYEALYFGRRGRMNNLAILSLLDGDSRYRQALEDTLWAICDEYTWCLPAHLQDSGSRCSYAEPLLQQPCGIIRQKLRAPETMLDLFAAETGFALAEILSLLGEQLDEAVVWRGRTEVMRRIIEPYQALNPMAWWETSEMNWAAVCAGSIGAAALYLIEDEAVLAPLLLRVLDTLETFIAGFGADGACTEGIGYWTYGFGFYVYFAGLLSERTAGRLDLLQPQKIARIAAFQQKCYLSANHVVSFSDAAATQNYQPGLTHYLKRRFPAVQAPERRYQAKLTEDPCRRWAPAIRDLLWVDPKLETAVAGEGTEFLKDAQWLIAKRQYQGEVLGFAAKGGHNGEPHNHNDVGSFLLHIAGETLLTDLGRGEYTRQYFRAERYQFLCTSSRGHSAPVINGQYQQTGAQFAASQLTVALAEDEDRLRMELAGAYGIDDLVSLTRQFVFAKAGPARLILTDRFIFRTTPHRITERFITDYQPQIIAPGRVRLQGLKASVDLIFESDRFQCRVHSEAFVTHESTSREVYLLDLEGQASQKEFTAEMVWEMNLEEIT